MNCDLKNCLKCNEIIVDEEVIVYCDSCERPIHGSCSSLNATEMKVMNLKGGRSLRFYCPDCTAGIKLIPKLIKKIDELQVEVNKLKNMDLEEKVVSELIERQKRANNIMIFNLPEDGPNDDMKKTKEILKEIVKEDVVINKVTRIGKRNKNGSRALKVVLSNGTDANKVIKGNKHVLKNKKIFIQADLTPYQTESFNRLKKELNERKSKGENDIALKYVKGVPQIVKLTQKN